MYERCIGGRERTTAGTRGKSTWKICCSCSSWVGVTAQPYLVGLRQTKCSETRVYVAVKEFCTKDEIDAQTEPAVLGLVARIISETKEVWQPGFETLRISAQILAEDKAGPSAWTFGSHKWVKNIVARGYAVGADIAMVPFVTWLEGWGPLLAEQLARRSAIKKGLFRNVTIYFGNVSCGEEVQRTRNDDRGKYFSANGQITDDEERELETHENSGGSGNWRTKS